MIPTDVLFFDTPSAFRAWLAAHAGETKEAWIGYYKIGTKQPSMTWSDSVDQALCYGWIDGQRQTLGSDSYAIRFTPRRKNSMWSAVNLAKMVRLREMNLMMPAGEEAFSWRQIHTRQLNPSEEARFNRATKARAYFEACPPGYKAMMVHWVSRAKRSSTRERRFEQLLQACKDGVRLPPI